MFKSKLFLKAMLVVSSIITIYTLAIYVFILPKMHHVTQELEEKNAHEALSKVTLLAQNTYKDMKNYEEIGLEQHKEKLRNAVNIVIALLKAKYIETSAETITNTLHVKAEKLQKDMTSFYTEHKTSMSQDALNKALMQLVKNAKIEEGTFVIHDQNTRAHFNLETVLREGKSAFSYHIPNKATKRNEEMLGYAFYFQPMSWVVEIHTSRDAIVEKTRDTVLSQIATFRYGDNNYFYISSYDNVIISHPYMHKVDMTNANDMRGKAIIPDITDLLEKEGEGFYRYFWKKNEQDTVGYEKMSFIKDFPEWEMVVMSGDYIDDIQAEIDKRKHHLMEQLTEIVQNTRIGKTGYLFLFDKNGTMLINPNAAIEGQNFKTIKNPTTEKLIFDELVEKATTTKELIYKWNRPEDLEHYRYDKIAWIEQIPELEWFVASSAYLEEFDESSKEIKYFASLLALILLCISAVYSFVFFKNILTPAINLSKHAVMGEMIAAIAHQWKQPLNELGLVLQKFEFAYHRKLLNQELLEKETQAARTLIAKMSDTIDIFKNFFSMKNNANTFDVGTSVQNIIQLMEKTLELDDISIITMMDVTCSLNSYQGEFEHVILNILMNAKDVLIHQKINEKIVLITTAKRDKTFTITIQDNGGGIADTIINQIFNPHFSTKKEGAGIGLYIAKQIIDEHIGGKLGVENKHFIVENEEYFGACFTIWLKI